MPIRPELRAFYSTPEWKATRARIRLRAGGVFDSNGVYRGGARCEQCGVLDRKTALRAFGWWTEASLEATVWMFGGSIDGRDVSQLPWHSPHNGRVQVSGFIRESCRWVGIVLTCAHLDHVAGHDTDDNLKLLCQWCHLHYDQGHHKLTRSLRKDRQRPLLA